MKWKGRGSILELPIYLEGLRRLSAQGILEKLKIDFREGAVDFQLRFLRANVQTPPWIEDRNDFSEKEKALLRQGWSLQYWQEFRRMEAKRSTQFPKDSFLIELSRRISLLRTTDRHLYWSFAQGFTEKSF